jgi:hypothetical protein
LAPKPFWILEFYLQIARKKRADEWTRTADLLITSKPVPYSEPARNGCFAGTYDYALFAKYPAISPNIASTADATADASVILTNARDKQVGSTRWNPLSYALERVSS